MLKVRVNAADAWRERVCTLTGEVAQAVSLAVATTNCEKSAEAIVCEKIPVTGKERRVEQSIS